MATRRKGAPEAARRAAVPGARRDAVQLRDNFTCVYCQAAGDPKRGAIITLDHVIPAHFGGADTASNLVTACSLCNWMKGVYPLDLWAQLAERLGYGDASAIQGRVRAALARKLVKRT